MGRRVEQRACDREGGFREQYCDEQDIEEFDGVVVLMLSNVSKYYNEITKWT